MASDFTKVTLVSMFLWCQLVFFSFVVMRDLGDFAIMGFACNILGWVIAFCLAFKKGRDSNGK